MKTKPFLTTSLLLVTILAFVYFAQPIYAKANSSDMDYVETSMSTAEVQALFTGASAIIPAAIMIIGFIVMCYCVLRNVEVPLQFSNQTSFGDKLTQLGQYAIDNAGDSIKDFLYSVYTYCNDNGITSIWGISKFVALNAGKFFGAITSWIGGSLINDVSDVGTGLLDSFSPLKLTSSFYSYSAEFETVFNSYSGYTYSATLGYYLQDSANCLYRFYTTSDFLAAIADFNATSLCVYSANGLVYIYLMKQVSDSSFIVSTSTRYVHEFKYGSSYNPDIAPNLSNYSSAYSTNVNSFSTFRLMDIIGSNILNFLFQFGLPVYYSPTSISGTGYFNNLTIVQDVINPAVDNVYVPTDVWNIDIVGTWAQIRDSIEGLNTQTEKIAAFVGDIPLTLTSAQAFAPTINDAGNYVFPSMDGIWKYPQYFFDTLKGWGLFVGGCLNAVTVGEGGLSWLFYGGFIIIVCGGIIGKILLG